MQYVTQRLYGEVEQRRNIPCLNAWCAAGGLISSNAGSLGREEHRHRKRTAGPGAHAEAQVNNTQLLLWDPERFNGSKPVLREGQGKSSGGGGGGGGGVSEPHKHAADRI